MTTYCVVIERVPSGQCGDWVLYQALVRWENGKRWGWLFDPRSAEWFGDAVDAALEIAHALCNDEELVSEFLVPERSLCRVREALSWHGYRRLAAV